MYDDEQYMYDSFFIIISNSSNDMDITSQLTVRIIKYH